MSETDTKEVAEEVAGGNADATEVAETEAAEGIVGGDADGGEADGGDLAEEHVTEEQPVEIPTAFGVPVTEVRSQQVLHPAKEELAELAATLKAEGYGQCVDLCAVDYLTDPDRPGLPASIVPERFEVVAVFITHISTSPHRIRARVQVPEDDPALPSITDVYPGTENMEREIYDMFGIAFRGNPDLTRILMPDEWKGHPLRRDYAVGQVPVQFKGAPS